MNQMHQAPVHYTLSLIAIVAGTARVPAHDGLARPPDERGRAPRESAIPTIRLSAREGTTRNTTTSS